MADQPHQSHGEQAEFLRLLTDHQVILRGYLRSLMPQETDLNDVLQDTNLTIWEQRETFELGTNFKAWCFAIARFRVLEFRKKRKRQRKLMVSAELAGILGREWAYRDVESMEAVYRAIEECIGQLREKDRALIYARYATRIPLAEYAKADGRSEPSLRVALNRLRNLLRQCVTAKLSDDGRNE